MKISQSQRLAKVLAQDKSNEPHRILPALKSDLRDLLREYTELDGDITVEIDETDVGYSVVVLAYTKRFKSYGR